MLNPKGGQHIFTKFTKKLECLTKITTFALEVLTKVDIYQEVTQILKKIVFEAKKNI